MRSDDYYKGCRGDLVSSSELDSFLIECFEANDRAESQGRDRFPVTIWGHAGVGKTSKVKQLANRPVSWGGKSWDGYEVYDVPIAQFEEMGDIHGMPSKHLCMTKDGDSKWVPDDVVSGYLDLGWSVDSGKGVKTMYAPPDWVPTDPGPSILLLDDWNRASVRILKGIMQLLQNFGMVSWSLPAGCQIVLTGNPDDCDYIVTSQDKAILSRQRHITLRHDVKDWSVWADSVGLDPRGINFMLKYEKMMIGPEVTNPRTLSEFFACLSAYEDLHDEDQFKRAKRMASSLLDEQTVTTMMAFLTSDSDLVIEPSDILSGEKSVANRVEGLMSGSEKRVDVLSITFDRLFSFMVKSGRSIVNDDSVNSFHSFVDIESIPQDLVYNFCQRLNRYISEDSSHAFMGSWLVGNQKLLDMVLDLT